MIFSVSVCYYYGDVIHQLPNSTLMASGKNYTPQNNAYDIDAYDMDLV